MITTKQLAVIKSVLGNHYTKKIIDELNKSGIVNSKGLPYSKDSIQKICKGSENLTVENKIIKLVSKVKKQREKQITIAKSILKK